MFFFLSSNNIITFIKYVGQKYKNVEIIILLHVNRSITLNLFYITNYNNSSINYTLVITNNIVT